MDKEELLNQFEKNVEYLRRNIPPDDIYLFCEQTFLAARYFLMKWSEHVKITEEMEKEKITDIWVKNIICLQLARDQGIDVSLDLDVNKDNV